MTSAADLSRRLPESYVHPRVDPARGLETGDISVFIIVLTNLISFALVAIHLLGG